LGVRLSIDHRPWMLFLCFYFWGGPTHLVVQDFIQRDAARVDLEGVREKD
jgi:hypothetical protein